MPWCEHCDVRLEEDELTEDGHCPTCEREPLEHRPQPWYVKFLVVATVIYLTYRLVQGIVWVVHHV